MKACAIVCTKNPAVVDVVSGALDDCGPRLLVCRSSLDVLGAAQVVDADLLILDLETPGLNGLLLISAIKKLAPALPIVAVSTKPHLEARAVSSTGVPYVPLTSRSNGREVLSTEVARLRSTRPLLPFQAGGG